MTYGMLFWLLMILWALFGFFWRFPGTSARIGPYGPVGDGLLLFVLLMLLGLKVFGWLLHG